MVRTKKKPVWKVWEYWVIGILLIISVSAISINSNLQDVNGGYEMITFQEDTNTVTSDLSEDISAGVCERKYYEKFGEEANCYVEGFSINNIEYYNGDGAESNQDEDVVTISQISCICFN